MNVLDSRWKAHGIDHAFARRPEIVVHARSTFLQGILLHPADCWPVSREYDAQSCVEQLHALVGKFGRENLADLCLAYVRAQSWITSLVIGCETMSQLKENLKLFCLPALHSSSATRSSTLLPLLPTISSTLSKWKPAHA